MCVCVCMYMYIYLWIMCVYIDIQPNLLAPPQKTTKTNKQNNHSVHFFLPLPAPKLFGVNEYNPTLNAEVGASVVFFCYDLSLNGCICIFSLSTDVYSTWTGWLYLI